MMDAFVMASFLTACIVDIAFVGGTILAAIECIKDYKKKDKQ